jgi:hypothetical protein
MENWEQTPLQKKGKVREEGFEVQDIILTFSNDTVLRLSDVAKPGEFYVDLTYETPIEWDEKDKPTRFDRKFVMVMHVMEGEGDPAPVLKIDRYNTDFIKSIETINLPEDFKHGEIEP